MKADLHTVSTSALAYLGDAAFEILVRDRLVSGGVSSAKALNAKAKAFVTAPAQAAAMEKIAPLLTEEESAVFHRGRNLGHSSTPKSATVAEYRNATGLEALFGFLYLTEQRERSAALFAAAFPAQSE